MEEVETICIECGNIWTLDKQHPECDVISYAITVFSKNFTNHMLGKAHAESRYLRQLIAENDKKWDDLHIKILGYDRWSQM